MQCALKKISKDKLRENPVYEDLMKDELSTLQKVSHPNIMRVFELLQDNTDIYVVTEFIKGGELMDRLVNNVSFDERQAAYIISQILQGLNNLHGQRIVHRDLKLENILLESQDKNDFRIKIADFGFARKIPDGETEDLQCGTPIYMAPEIVKGLPYQCEVDIWSTGVITYILLSGDAPFKGNNKLQIQREIKNKVLTMNDAAWTTISDQAKDFIRLALNRDQQKRGTAQ